MDVRERFQNAADLVKKGQYHKATDEFIWLWNHMLDEDKSFTVVRYSYLIGWMKRLMELHEDAQVRFTALRDQLTPRFEPGSTDYRPISDWFTLCNNLLEDHSAIATWVDELLACESKPLELRIMRGTIISWMFEQDRWKDAGELLDPGPVVAAEARLSEEREKYNDEFNEETRNALRENRLKSMAMKQLCYDAAGRIEESQLTMELMIELFGNDQTQSMIQDLTKERGQ